MVNVTPVYTQGLGAFSISSIIAVYSTCDLKVNDFIGSSTTIDPLAGGTVDLTGSISDSSGSPISWSVTVAGKTYTGSGTGVSVTWDGKNSDGTVAEPGSYSATLKAWLTEDPTCTDSKTINFTVEESDNSCSLSVNFSSSANVASGNLSHSQPLFTTKGSGLSTNITLYYNSLDPYAGPLGRGWMHNYDIGLKENSDGLIVLRKGDGGRRLYRKSGNGYRSQRGDYSVLSKNVDGTFVIINKDGSKYNFSTDGNITSVVDRNGNTITFVYTGGNLTTITDPAGRVTTLAYDANNNINTITDSIGSSYTFTVTNDTLTALVYPGGGQSSYTYDQNGFMLTKTDPNGNTTAYTYDSEHRVLTATDAEGAVKSIIYPSTTDTTRTTTVTEKDGGLWQYTYDTQAGTLTSKTDPQGGVTSYTYDQNRNTTSRTDPDNSATTYTYDAIGNMTSTTDALGQTTSYTYNSFGQATSITDPQGSTTTSSYDEKGNLTSTADAAGATTSYEYDNQGHVTKVTNPAGQSTTYAYDQSGNLSSVTDPAGATTSFTYDAAGNVTSQTDANGSITRYEYDSSNRLIKVTDPAGNSTTFGYDANGNRTSQTDANGNVTSYEYNSKGQLIKVIDALGNTTTYTYGGAGCASCGSGGGDKIISVTDANGNTNRFEYDHLGRKVKDIDALGNETSYTYDSKGNLLTKTDANGHVTSFAYDPLGRVREQIDALMGVVKFEYSPKGQITKVTDALGNATTYEYDAMGRVIKTASPDTGIVTYTYNVTGTLAGKTDASGTTIKYQYDSQNRLTTIDFPSDIDITYTYDDCVNGKGRVCTMIDQAGTTEYEYDKLSRIVKEKKTILGSTYVTGYSYDKSGAFASITLPSGRQIAYTYDKVSRPASVSAKLGTQTALAASGLSYDPVGNITSRTLGNGLTQSWAYDPNNRMKTIAVPGIMSLSYGYDPVGNITSITDGIYPEKSKSYTYDPLDRLASALGPWGTLAWTYDANGNRLAQGNGVNYTYTYSANRLTTASNGHIDYYQYDNNGNTTNDGSKDFVYNQNQRLIRSTESGKTLSEYVYNGKGERVIKKTGPANANSASSQNTVYHYDLAGRLIEETDGNGKLIADYVYLNNQPLAMIRKQANNEETFYYHNDHLGTPKVMTDKLRKVVWNVEFDPFGNEVEQKGRAGSYIRNVTNNLRFPGQYFDAETGLHQNYFRDYNPVIGRYIESDPTGLEGGINLYVYAKNNPIRFTDPRGLAVWVCSQQAQLSGGWLAHQIGWDHQWLRTNSVEAGYGPPNGQPAGSPMPGDPVTVTDHTGRSTQPGARCVEKRCIDEACVNRVLLALRDRPLGTWGPFNNCNTFASNVLEACRL